MVKDGANITIGAFYRQPTSVINEIDDLMSRLLGIPNGNRATEFILGGDFNLPGIIWGENVTIKDTPSYGSQVNERLIELCDTLGLTQVVHQPTRENNIPDLCLVTSPDKCTEADVLTGISDHDAVCMSYNRRVNRNKETSRKVYLFKRADMESLKGEITHYYNDGFKQHLEGNGINETWEQFKEVLYQLMKNNIPHRNIKQNCKLPWVNNGIRRLMRRRKRARAKSKKTGKVAGWNRYKEMEFFLKKQPREAHTEYLTNIFADDDDRLNKKAWAYIKSRRKENIGIPPLVDKNGRLCEESQDKAEILCEQYTSVFTKDDGRVPVPTVPYNLPSMLHLTIDANGVNKLLTEVNINKANGPDLIPNTVLKECNRELAPILTDIFRKSLRDGRLPKDWLNANVVGIYKKGPKQEARNYRPISITSVTTSKIIEHILFSQIRRHYTHHSFIVETQHGFQKRLSCDTQLVITTEQLQKGMDQKYQQNIILLDIQKAFDKVPHRHLLKKLEAGGVRGDAHGWLRTYLTCRTQRVVVDGRASQEVPVLSGVPQGTVTVLGPLMFLTYINDINRDISGTIKFFSDDALLFHQIRSDADCVSLQKDIDTINSWSRRWRMQCNASKCHVLQVTKKKSIISHAYSSGQEKLSVVPSHPYLGIEIDNKLSWKQQIEKSKHKSIRTCE